MGAKRGNPEQSSQAVELFSLGETRDPSSYNGEGSNVLILPGKRRTKTKGKDKVSKRTKAKEAPSLSKCKIRKLQKLQEEKEKKLLLFKSINLLQKYKINDNAYSILKSSGTIGQAETAREKRRLAVQYSKAGLELPENVSLFKKEKPPSSSENELVSKPSDEGNLAEFHDKNLYLTKQLEKESYGFQTPKKFPEKDDHSGALPVKHLEKDHGKGPPIPMENDGNCPEHSLQSNADILVNGAIGANICPEKVEGDMHNVHDHVPSSAIVVQISRPQEVEEKRRNLPIIMMEQEIMEAINEHPVLILCGETGCGKTTQVPQFLYEAGYGSSNNSDWKGVIGITQPRRVAVLATAKRVSYELGLHLGKGVGFQVRHDKMIGSSCSIKFMTDGILLREAQSDFLLRRYSVIILDEAHERSLNTDILIGMLSRIIKIRQELYEEQQNKILSGAWISPDNMITRLKLVLMSATLRVEDFVSNKKLFHDTPPVLEVPVRQFPVTIHFSRKTPDDYLGQAYKKVLSIHKRLPPGGILVFVTGQREVELLCKKLRKASQKFSCNNLKKMGSDVPASFEPNMQEIDEAFGLENDFPNQQHDSFSSYEDDFEEVEQSSDPDTDSEGTEDGEYEGKLVTQDREENSLMLSFLRNPESLSSLKAAFENLSGKFSNQSSVKEQGLQCTSLIKQSDAEPPAVLRPLYVLPLYAMLPASQQLRVFETVPEGERLVVVATNVAETSLTIPGIKYVVDTGKEKVKNYNYGNGMATYEVQWISKASAEQRAGRAGRTGPGHCYRLYSSAAFGKDDIFPKFSCPEISKIPVDGVLLLMKYMGIDKVVNFPFPTPPEPSALREAEACLTAIEALNGDGRLTSLGRAMAQYPMSPRHSRMILTVIQILRSQPGFDRANFVLGYSVAAAAALSFPNPFLMQLEMNQGTEENDMVQEDGYCQDRKKKIKAMSKESRAKLCNPSSDALTVAYALQLFELANNSFEFCRNNSLHLKTMEEMSKLRKQILQLIFHQGKFSHEFSWDCGSLKDVEDAWLVHSPKHPLQMSEEELIGQAICGGWVDRVAKRVRTVSGSSQKEHKVRAMRYQSCASDDAVYLHRWSSVSQTAPEFVVYSELLCTKRPYMHGVTAVKADWLVSYTKPLCRFSTPLTDPKPYYEPLSDRLFCWVSPTFGRHNWQLPLHSLPIKNEDLRLSVFACALLEGDVLPCLRSAKSFLAAPPLTMLRPEALGQRRVGDLLSRLRMASRTIDSRAKLREVWSENPMYLHLEIRNWFQERFQGQFCVLWEQMLHEALLEGFELFPKRAKKNRKIIR